ncbi:hypothetical protein LRX75_18615 [Rhizobium sp. DKSPLA3]|uniref:Uncharacterized protein n=1 Tax=Rhizobium quercicola TaxID=2901226 RepID=A0A9X1NU18_9HYPH|nr:hypothetical protein [Rhizobium quercicola]MCD7111052.1 hypothetical protein [Rhizobium quercicola]
MADDNIRLTNQRVVIEKQVPGGICPQLLRDWPAAVRRLRHPQAARAVARVRLPADDAAGA